MSGGNYTKKIRGNRRKLRKRKQILSEKKARSEFMIGKNLKKICEEKQRKNKRKKENKKVR